MKLNRPDSTLPFAKDHRYGWITKKESQFVENLLGEIQKEFGQIRFLEIGVFGGCTMLGITEWAENHGCPCQCEGVDIGPKPNFVPEGYVYHQGDSMDQWRSMSGEFNLLWVDGCHCIIHSMCDFLNYSPFVTLGGYCLFHDTAGIGGDDVQGEYPQDHSYAGKPSSVLGVRQGLKKMGLLQGHRTDWQLIGEIKESDIMGMSVFKKMKAL